MKVAIYARNSKPPRDWDPSKHPGEEPPGSWKIQLEQLRAWAGRQDHAVILEEHDMASGRDPNRQGWERVMQEARGHHVEAIVATKLDRVMRSAPHFYQIAEELTALGVDLVFTDNGMRISKRDPFNKATLGILAVVAELELDLARERQAAVMHRGEDGRLYGPRSKKPVGALPKYGEGHRFRIRKGRRQHDKARCHVCGAKGGGA